MSLHNTCIPIGYHSDIHECWSILIRFVITYAEGIGVKVGRLKNPATDCGDLYGRIELKNRKSIAYVKKMLYLCSAFCAHVRMFF